MIRGYLEILEMADSSEPKNFNDFTKITIKKRRLSSATVAKRLHELIEVKAVEAVVYKSKTGRRIIAYNTTEKGRKVIKLANALQDALSSTK
ncbi:MAG: winged helix-turn-helix transcriptional regulator [Candidatus Micrarchaeaceae archaeon]